MATRILHVLSSLEQIGAVTQLALLSNRLVGEGFDVSVCALSSARSASGTVGGIPGPVMLIRQPWKLDPSAAVRLQQHVKRLQPAVVHTWQYPASLYGRAAAARARVKGIVRWEPQRRARRTLVELAFDRLLNQRSQRIVVTGNEVRQVYIRDGVPADRLAVIPCAAPEPTVTAATRRQVRQDLGLPNDAWLIGTVGPLVPDSRLKDCIWTADLLKVLHDEVHLLVIGDGPQRWRLQRFCRQVRNADRVHFLGHRPDHRRLISHVDCFWSAGHQAEQACAILTAMAAGVPVVAADGPLTRDLVIPEKTGMLYPTGNRAALARRTNSLLDDPARARELGEAARQRMRDKFNVDTMVQRYVALYRELLDGKTTDSTT